MTPQQTVGLGVRLFAIWLAIGSIKYFSSVPAAIVSLQQASEKLIESFAVATTYLVVAGLLWFFPMVVAHKLIPRSIFDDKLSIESVGIARVGCCLIGLWFLATNIQSLVWYLFLGFLTSSSDSFFNMLTTANKVGFFVSIFEVVFALLLMTQSKFFARIVIR